MAYDGSLIFDTKIDLKGYESGLKKIEASAESAGKAFAPFSAAAAGVATGLLTSAVSAGKFADDVNTMAKVTGISTQELQKFMYASDLIDVSMETLTGSLTKLTRNMNDASQGTGSAKDVFRELGISVTNADGTLRNSQDVFYETIDALGTIENSTLRDAVAMEVFGRSAQELNPLILGGAEDLKRLGLEAESLGLILSQDALDGANSFNDVLDTLNATATATKNTVGATLGEALIPIAEKLSGAIISLSESLAAMDEDTLTFILGMAGIVAVVTPLLLLIGNLAGGLANIIRLVGLLTAKMAISTGATVAATGATTAAGAAATGASVGVGLLSKAVAFLFNPVTLIIAAIALLVVGIVGLWKTSEEFRDFWIAVWEKIKAAPKKAIDDIKADLAQWKDIGVKIVNGMFDGIKAGWQAIENWVNDKFGWLDNLVSEFSGGGGTKAQDSRGRVSGSYAAGLSSVGSDMIATVHRGEKIVPANQSNADTMLLQQVVSELRTLQRTVHNQPYVERNILRVEGVR